MKHKQPVTEIILHMVISRKMLSAGILSSVAGSIVLSLLPPLVLAGIIDRLTAGDSAAFSSILFYFLLIAAAGIAGSLQEGLLIIFGQKITHALRSALCAKLSALSADDLTKQESGVIVSRFLGDVNTVETLFTSGIISMFADACRVISILIILWIKNRGLTLLLLLILPVVFLYTRFVQKRMLKAQLQNRSAISRVTNHVPETFRCIRTIHTLGRESFMEDCYDEYISSSYQAIEKNNFYDSIYSPVILILNAIIIAAVMLLSSSGNLKILSFFGMSVGTAVAVINYISQVFSPLESLGMEIQTIQSAAAGVKRLNKFLSQKEKWACDPRLEPNPNTAVCIEFHNVSFGYDPEKPVLKNLSFSVERGEHITLCGRTGAGKSTIFKLLLGLYRPDHGTIIIDGCPADLIDDGKKRHLFGYVEQSFHSVPGTIRDQIALSDPDITDEMVEKALRLTGLYETVISTEKGLLTPCSSSLFSQGQWQLLSIARAVAADPGILLLDEITANLDSETEKTVLQALKTVSRDRTVLSISHRVYSEKETRILSVPSS